MDRNIILTKQLNRAPPSLSARRAWIETTTYLDTSSMDESLSARRAWIETTDPINLSDIPAVALRKESVDRNVFGFGAKLVHSCRSPQGERG